MIDTKLPHEQLRVRVHGGLFVAQPYAGESRVGEPLVIDLDTGRISLAEKMIDLSTDYTAAYAILGVQRLTGAGVAVAVATAAKLAANVAGAEIYEVTATSVLTANGAPPADKTDAKLVAYLEDAVAPLGVGMGLYFSLQCNVTLTQQAAAAADKGSPIWQRSERRSWINEVLLQPLCNAQVHRFIVPCILGFVKQATGISVKGGTQRAEVTMTLVARRSRHRAGTRHWRRGIDGKGNVANFVETEQLVQTGDGAMMSFVQCRGSIPLFWSQVPNTKYKPPTVMADDDVSAEPFRRHAADLKQRYGAVTAVDLVNQHGSEGKLAKSYGHVASRLPASDGFHLVPFDFHKECGKISYENLAKLWASLEPAADEHGVFMRNAGGTSSEQRGVMRTNCIDCLDRTNVVQALLARKAFERFLRTLLLLPSGQGMADAFPGLERRFKIVWAEHGDMLSTQYAGTGALKSGFTRTGKRTTGGLIDDGLKSCVRYFLNNYEDGQKQDAFDLLSGTFRAGQDSMDDFAQSQSSGAMWLVAAFALLIASFCALTLAPFSEKVTLLYHTLPPFVLAVVAIGAVLALGQAATCRPQLKPSLVQPWLPPVSTAASTKSGKQAS